MKFVYSKVKMSIKNLLQLCSNYYQLLVVTTWYEETGHYLQKKSKFGVNYSCKAFWEWSEVLWRDMQKSSAG